MMGAGQAPVYGAGPEGEHKVNCPCRTYAIQLVMGVWPLLCRGPCFEPDLMQVSPATHSRLLAQMCQLAELPLFSSIQLLQHTPTAMSENGCGNSHC